MINLKMSENDKISNLRIHEQNFKKSLKIT